MGDIRLKRQLNRALYFAALEKAAASEKETEKDLVIETMKADDMGAKLEVKNGLIQSQVRTEYTLEIGATLAALKSGVISLDLFLQHVKPTASLKVALGEALTSELMTERKVDYWLLKPNEATKNRAAASFAEFIE